MNGETCTPHGVIVEVCAPCRRRAAGIPETTAERIQRVIEETKRRAPAWEQAGISWGVRAAFKEMGVGDHE